MPRVRFEQALVDTGGSVFPLAGSITAFIGDQRVGSIDFLLNKRRTAALISMIAVERTRRRHGVATAIVNELRRLHPSVNRFQIASYLPEGRRFATAYRRRSRKSDSS